MVIVRPVDPVAATSPRVTFCICTRNRAPQLAATLDALERQTVKGNPILVLDQSDQSDPAVAARDGVTVIDDRGGRGLSRVRNLGWPLAETEWVAFIDDDCLLAPDWSERLAEELDAHPEAALISGHVAAPVSPKYGELAVTAFPVDELRVRRGSRTWPFEIGFGVCMVLRRSWIERLGGWDERMGAGVPDIPAGEDMDFNYRLLRAGGIAVATPRLRAVHDQWRSPGELPRLFYGYAIGWAAFAMKQLHLGDVVGAIRLWAWGAYGAVKMVASAARRRSRLRLAVACSLARGHAVGTARGLLRLRTSR